jgi:cytochrome P450
LTTYALLELHRNPDQLALLRAEPSLARGALDETLRYNSFGRAPMARFASERFSYNDVTFERGSPVYVSGRS